MKKLITLLILFICGGAYAQTTDHTPTGAVTPLQQAFKVVSLADTSARQLILQYGSGKSDRVVRWPELLRAVSSATPAITTIAPLHYSGGTLTIDAANSTQPGILTASMYNTFNGKQNALTFDATPTNGSTNPVTSDGVYDAIAAATPVFTSDIPVNIASGKTFGKYVNGDVIPATGKTYQQVITDAVTETVHPTYTQPSATVSGSPGTSTLEYGSSFTETLSSTFTQADAGSLISTTYYRGASSLSGNTDVVSSLTSALTYTVRKSYNAGACKTNNLGVVDCTGGPVAAGTVTSSNSIIITPGYRRYQGFISDTTGIASGSKNSVILALVNSGVFSTSQVFSSFNTGNPTGTQFYIVAYVATSPDITSITQNGFPSIAAFSHATVSSFTNNQGATVPIKVYWSKNGQTSSSTISTN